MARRKSEIPKPIAFSKIQGEEPPVWNDVLRGILIALVEQRRALWDARFRSTKERCIQLCQEISAVLSNQDARINEWAVLEKWCWMMEMFSRASEKKEWNWRYSSAMSFISSFSGNGSQYLGCLTMNRFLELTRRYAVEKQELDAANNSSHKPAKKTGTAWFIEELEMYSKCEPEASRNAMRTMTSILSIPNTSTPKSAPIATIAKAATPELRLIAKRGRASRSTRGEPAAAEEEAKSMVAAQSAQNPEKSPVTATSAVSQKSLPKSSPEVKEDNKVVSPPVPVASTSAISDALRSAFTPRQVKQEEEQTLTQRTVYIPTEREAFPTAPFRADTWSVQMVRALIGAVKDRPILWHSQHPHFRLPSKRNEAWKELLTLMRKLPGSENINEEHISEKWKTLREYFNKQQRKVRGGATSSWEYFSLLQFLTPQVMMACRFDDLQNDSDGSTSSPPIATNDRGQTTPRDVEIRHHLQNFLGYAPPSVGSANSSDSSGPPMKRSRQSSPPTQDMVTRTPSAPPHIVATWVPPREDTIAAAMQTMISPTSHAPTATAQILSTSSDTLSSLLRIDPSTPNGGSSVQPMNSINNGERRRETKDKWRLMGELVEQTCREMDQKNPQLAIHLQKEINDVIFKYQLKNLGDS